MAVPPPTVATPDFLGFNTNDVLDQNYDMIMAVFRALKVFVISYYHYERLCPQLFVDKINEYMDAIEVLYNYQIPDRLNWLNLAKQTIAGEMIEITVGVKKFRGRDRLYMPRIIVNNGISVSPRLGLDVQNEVQNTSHFTQQIDFNTLSQIRLQNPIISIQLEAADWKQSEDQLNTFQITYPEIHVEGFEDWFDFGRGVEMLVKIQFRVVNEPNITAVDVSKFQVHAIYLMVIDRLERYREEPNRVQTRHRSGSHSVKVSYIQQRIDPNSVQAFWSTPNILPDLMENIRRGGQHELRGQTIKFNDLQIGLEYYDEFEDSVCVCNEWCNWNAFFHFNPIYRFLTVQHNQLYMQNRGNIADIYLFIATTFFHEAGVDPNDILEVPVMRLIYCGNKYRILYNRKYISRGLFASVFTTARPRVGVLNGVSYNQLRYNRAVTQICVQSDRNPFADNCVENIILYYRVLTDLHYHLATPPYIPFDDQSYYDWCEELEKMSRDVYKTYIKLSYDKQMSIKSYSYDYLFSEEYSSASTKTEGEVEIKSFRSNVLKMTASGNPFNLRFICNEFVSTYLAVYKFMATVEPTIPRPHCTTALATTYDCIKRLDTDFNNYRNGFYPKTLNYLIPEDITHRGLEGIRKSFVVFYTLRLYCVGFEYQRYYINTVVNYNKALMNKTNPNLNPNQLSRQVFQSFVFIWNHEIIEEHFTTLYTNESLFRINDEMRLIFNAFYQTYWGRAVHETKQQISFAECVDSAYFEYQRLYFWWTNNGNKRLKFTRIFDSFANNFEDNISRSEGILSTHILPSIQLLSQNYEYFMEVLDHLVYYLVKANCFIFLSSVSRFLFYFNSLIIPRIRNWCFIQSKPGWVQLFRSLRTVIDFLNRLKSIYIVFDDEFDRIAETLDQTKRMIKEIYKCFYRKLSYDWSEEILLLYHSVRLPYPGSLFLPLHFAVGLSFMAAFIDDFREDWSHYRRWCSRILNTLIDPNFSQQAELNACEPVFQSFLRDKNAIAYAQPLCTEHWQIHLFQIFRLFNQNWDKQLGIDMDLADV